MNLGCSSCCASEVVPSRSKNVSTFDAGKETPTDFFQEGVIDPVVTFGVPGTDETQFSSNPDIPEVRVDKPENMRDANRDRSNMPNASPRVTRHLLPAGLQLLIMSWIQPRENKLNTKLFGSAKAVRNEQSRHKEAGWIIHPCSAFRLYWNLVMLLLLIMNMYALPVAMTFFNENLPVSWLVFNIVCDIFFLTDLVINFRTGIMVNDSSYRFILEPKRIAIKYLRTWFLVDLISSVPMDYIISAVTHGKSELVGASRALRVLRMARLLSLLRLLRVSRLVRYISQYEVIFNMTKSFMRWINLIAIMTLVAHWNACLQYLVPAMSDFPSSSWVSIHNLEDVSWSSKYIWSIFKALSHMLCIGYGRFPPQNIQEVIVTAFSMLSGATCYGIFIAYCISAIQQTDSSRRQYYERVQQISEYMSYRKLPTLTREKVLSYFEHRYKGKFFNEQEILGEVSSPLRNEIISYNCRDLVSAVPFFNEADPVFVSAIIKKLYFEVFLEGDVIIQEGTLGTDMYFLREGSVEIRMKDNLKNVLYDGSYFGEICLLTNARRVATVTACSTCDTFVLSASDFHDVLEEFPEARAQIAQVAEDRLNTLRERHVSLTRSPRSSCTQTVDRAIQHTSSYI